jgi:putative transposase
VSDALFNGKKFRALTVVGNHTRECLAIEVGQSLTGDDVAMVLTEIAQGHELPSRIQADNGPEFISISLDKWPYDHGVTMDFSRPGKPTDNPFIESFNGSLRDECLNVHWFMSLEDARQKIETWRQDYNNFRPHSADVGHRTSAVREGNSPLPPTAGISRSGLSSLWEEVKSPPKAWV